jgi:FG-GAP-like repeat
MTTTPKIWRATQQANFTDAGDQFDPAIVDIGSGRYVAVWTEAVDGPIGTSPGMDLVGQIFDTRGNRIGGEFQVNRAFFNDDEVNASLDTRPGGGFVMAYVDVDAAGASIRAQTYDVNGALVVSAPITIQADTGNDFLSVPTVAVRADGSYLVAYNRAVAADGTADVVGRVVSAAGAVGAEFSIYNSDDAAYLTDVDVLSNGNFVIGLQDADDPAQSDFDPLFQIFTSTGAFVAGNPIDTGPNGQGGARVATLTGGGFVAVWMELNIDGDAAGIRARIYNNAGTALTAPFTVNTTTAGDQREPDVTALNDGGFVVAWNDLDLHVWRGQRFDAAGHGVGVEFTAGDMGLSLIATAPVIATLSDGRFIVGFDQFPVAGDADIWATLFDPRTSPTVNFPSPFCDFDDDGKSGVLWRHDSGQVYFWEMNGLAIKAEGTVAHAPVPADWHIQGAGDFDGDGKNDVLWRHDSGQVYFWEMNGLGIKAEGGVAHAPVPNDWHVQGVGDFDGDGKSDILWRHDSGQVYFWEMNGLGIKAEGAAAHAAVPNDWHIQGVGDFDGDGKSDILWRHDSGQVYIWEMDGLTIKAEGAAAHAAVPNDWHIQGIGDFDGDGKSDILWRHDSGQVYTWEMNGLGVHAEGAVAHAAVPNDWHVQDIGDYNSDGKSDILWRHDSGQVYTWEMNGLGVTAEGGVAHAPVPSDWHIFTPYNFV